MQSWLSRLLKSFCLSGFILLAITTLTWEILGWPLIQRVNLVQQIFWQGAGRSSWSVLSELGGGLWYSRQAEYPTHRWLILGTDEVEDSHRPNVLTDTIMLVSYKAENNSFNIVSFPRDIYLPEYQIKINQLYQLGRDESPQQPLNTLELAMESMIGKPLNGVIVLSLADVGDLIDRLGGVGIEVPNTFTDEKFPRSGVDVTTETDPSILYETIHFESGWQWMDGETALKYLRSRQANEFIEQGDQARMRRQKQVVAALASQMQRPEIVGDAYRLGLLYEWYANNVMPQLSLFDVGWFGGTIARKNMPEINSVALPISEEPVATDEATLFIHPPNSKYQQWAFEAVDPTWGDLQLFLDQNGFR